MNSKDETLFSSPLLEARIHRVISMGRERDRKREREEDLEEGGKEIDNGKREDAKSKRKMEYSSGSESDSDSGGGSESSESGDERRHKRSKRKHRSSKRRSRKRHSDEYSDSDSGSSSYESDSDSEDSLSESEDERRRRKRKERKKREERDRKRRRREKEKKRGRRDEDDEKSQKKKKTDKEKKKKKKKKDKGKKGPVTNSWGKYGIIKEVDMWNKRPEFTAWLLDVKQVNLESLPNYEEKNMYKEYMEDYNTATLPSKKYYNLDIYHKNKLSKQMRKGMKKVVAKERTVFNDEEQRRLELMQEREKQKQQEVVSLKNAMQSGMAQAMKEQARLKEEMQYLYKVGNYEAAAVIQRKLDPDVAM